MFHSISLVEGDKSFHEIIDLVIHKILALYLLFAKVLHIYLFFILKVILKILLLLNLIFLSDLLEDQFLLAFPYGLGLKVYWGFQV